MHTSVIQLTMVIYMKKNTKPQKTQEFTLVAPAPPSELRASALFHHIDNIDLASLQSSNSEIKSIINPSKDRHAYLINLLAHNDQMNDLIPLMAASLKNKYPKIKFYDHHIRIDENFGALHSKVANQQLFAHWHYTARYNVGNEQSINVHLYFHYGIFLSAYIRDPDGNKTLIDMGFASKARENAQAACSIVGRIIDDMKYKKEELTQKFEKLATELNSKEYLLQVNRENLDMKLRELEEVDHLLGLYLQEEVSKLFIENRFSGIKTRILDLHSKINASSLTPAATVAEPDKFPKQSSKQSSAATSDDKDKSLSPPKDIFAELDKIFDKFMTIKELPIKLKTTEDYKKYDASYQDLKDELTVFFCKIPNNGAEEPRKILARLNVVEKLVMKLPTLLQIFEEKVSNGDFYAVKQLFKLIKFILPSDFYMKFLQNNFKKNNSQQQDEPVLELCRFFFESSADYRIVVSLLKNLSNPTFYADAPSIFISPLAAILIAQRFSLAKLLIEQSGSKDIPGVSFNNRGCSLLDFLCHVGINYESDGIINFMLDSGYRIQNDFPFANGIMVNTVNASSDKKISKFLDYKHAEETVANSNLQSFNTSFLKNCVNIPYMGSSLSSYCSARFQSSKVLERLVKMSDTIHLLISAGSFNLLGINGSLLYAKKQIRIVTKKTNNDKIALINKLLNEKKDQKTTHIGYCWGSEDTRLHDCIEILTTEINDRACNLSKEEMSRLISMLKDTMSSHTQRGDHLNSIACQGAIICLLTFMDSSLASHRLLLQTLYKSADSYKALSAQSGKIQLDYTSNEYLVLAKQFVELSVFEEDLKNDPEYISAFRKINMEKLKKSNPTSFRF